jgi:hypothetical protein
LAVVAGDDAGPVVGLVKAVPVPGFDRMARVGWGGVAGLDVPAGQEQRRLDGHYWLPASWMRTMAMICCA